VSTSIGAAEWIYAALKANTTLCGVIGGTAAPRIYHEIIPQSADLPSVVYQMMTSIDENAIGARGPTVQQWQVKGVAQGQTYNALRTVADQIDVALHRVHGTATTAGIVTASERIEEVMYGEASDGREYRHLGGIYRIYAAGTA
jgi:hypothetical protein